MSNTRTPIVKCPLEFAGVPLPGKTLGSAADGFVVAEWQDPGSPPGQRRLIASLCVLVGDAEVEAHAGAAVLAPRGTPRPYWNPGSGRVRYLLIMTANVFRLIQEMHRTPDRIAAVLRELFHKYGSELLEP